MAWLQRPTEISDEAGLLQQRFWADAGLTTIRRLDDLSTWQLVDMKYGLYLTVNSFVNRRRDAWSLHQESTTYFAIVKFHTHFRNPRP